MVKLVCSQLTGGEGRTGDRETESTELADCLAVAESDQSRHGTAQSFL